MLNLQAFVALPAVVECDVPVGVELEAREVGRESLPRLVVVRLVVAEDVGRVESTAAAGVGGHIVHEPVGGEVSSHGGMSRIERHDPEPYVLSKVDQGRGLGGGQKRGVTHGLARAVRVAALWWWINEPELVAAVVEEGSRHPPSNEKCA